MLSASHFPSLSFSLSFSLKASQAAPLLPLLHYLFPKVVVHVELVGLVE